MARLPYADPENPTLRQAASAMKASRGRLGHLHRMLLHSPPVAVGWIRFFDAVRREAVLPGSLRELVICQVAAINGARYEWEAHAPIGLREGLTQAQLDALPDWQGATVFDAAECAALALCDAMTRQVHVPERVFAAVRATLAERKVVELVVTIAGYNCVSRVLEALQINGQDPLP